jgi:hypothetical protein
MCCPVFFQSKESANLLYLLAREGKHSISEGYKVKNKWPENKRYAVPRDLGRG